MGCKYYDCEKTLIQFGDAQGDVWCLCTFPHNDNEQLSVDRIKSLAMLGATVTMLHSGDIKRDGIYTYIPYCLPDWFISELNRLLPEEE